MQSMLLREDDGKAKFCVITGLNNGCGCGFESGAGGEAKEGGATITLS
jgi:hypothetical protein